MSDSIMKMLQQQNENYENAIQDAREQLAKQAEIIKILKDCVETIFECEVIDTAAKLCSKATLKRVKILTAKYKGKE